ncbi:MAG: MBL fold metallo-hydrolase [Bryobacteraceae bacterium]|nr:MBL fold metallo-hydrolase [Bryobacteraceae bacterium]
MAFLGEVLTLTVLGSGTSVGVPTIGCHCEVCASPDPRDKRLRPSVLIRYGGRSVLIDVGPDFRQQALRARIDRIDAILFTHAHADHIMGLDDVRPFNFHQKEPIPIYGSEETLAVIQRVFKYVFDDGMTESSRPKLAPRVIDGAPIHLFGLDFTPIPLRHGKGNSLGFLFGRAAYLTDHSEIPESSKEKLHSLDCLFLDALRHKPHPTHTTVQRALDHVAELRPKRAYLTHICHDLSHQREEETLPPHVRLAYDGLEIAMEIGP